MDFINSFLDSGASAQTFLACVGVGGFLSVFGTKFGKVSVALIGSIVGASVTLLLTRVFLPQLATLVPGDSELSISSDVEMKLLLGAAVCVGLLSNTIVALVNVILFGGLAVAVGFSIQQSFLESYIDDIANAIGLKSSWPIFIGIAFLVSAFGLFKFERYVLRVICAALGGAFIAIAASQTKFLTTTVDFMRLVYLMGQGEPSLYNAGDRVFYGIWGLCTLISLVKESGRPKKVHVN